MDAREASICFAEAFCASDLARLGSLIAPFFRLRGPLFRCDTRDDYLRSLQENPPAPGPCRILHVSGSAEEAAILYEYGRSPTPVLVAQFNRVSDGLISSARLVFDTSGIVGR